MQAHLRGIRISAKKLNIVAGLVREAKVEDALNQLKFTPKKAAKLLYKVIQSAASNATHNNAHKMEDLMVAEILVNRGPSQKRFLPSTRGRALPIVKPTAHISVKLAVIAKDTPKSAPAKKVASKTK